MMKNNELIPSKAMLGGETWRREKIMMTQTYLVYSSISELKT